MKEVLAWIVANPEAAAGLAAAGAALIDTVLGALPNDKVPWRSIIFKVAHFLDQIGEKNK